MMGITITNNAKFIGLACTETFPWQLINFSGAFEVSIGKI
jgi:hypothetical protein